MLLAEQLNWQTRGACAAAPDLWADPDSAAVALHICRHHCLVLDECKVWADQIGGWEAIVVAGVQWATRRNNSPAVPVVRQREQLCDACLALGSCTECGRVIDRGPRAKTCSSACATVRQRRMSRLRARQRRQCRVCRSRLGAGVPNRQPVCGKPECREVWRARQSRATTARARTRREVVTAA